VPSSSIRSARASAAHGQARTTARGRIVAP
jgi:hypothetical protein